MQKVTGPRGFNTITWWSILCSMGDFITNNFSMQFRKIISHDKTIGYNINVLRQTACLVVNPITVYSFAFSL